MSWSLLLRVVLAAAVVALCVIGLRHVDLHSVKAALAGARIEWVVAAALLNFVHILIKSERWHLMLSPFGRVGRARLYHYLIVSYAASSVLPGRVGELLRPYLVRRRAAIPVPVSLGIIVVEKLFEALGLLILVAPLPFCLPGLPKWAAVSIGALGAGGVAGVGVMILLVPRFARKSGESFWTELARGLDGMRQPRIAVGALAWSLASFLCDAIEVWMVLYALHIQVPWATPALILLTLNLAIALPSTPAQVGAFEAGAVTGLHAMGVYLGPALAFALIYHVMQVVPVLLTGLTGIGLIAEARADVAKSGNRRQLGRALGRTRRGWAAS